MEYIYDIAFSYAEEDRAYVDEVAAILRENEVKIFCDKFDEVELWGQDMSERFCEIFQKSSRYFVPFISQHYKKKAWEKFQIKTALKRVMESNSEYMLPARFDDTEISEILPTISCIDLRNRKPNEFANIVIQKLGYAMKKIEIKNETISSDELHKGQVVSLEDDQRNWIEYWHLSLYHFACIELKSPINLKGQSETTNEVIGIIVKMKTVSKTVSLGKGSTMTYTAVESWHVIQPWNLKHWNDQTIPQERKESEYVNIIPHSIVKSIKMKDRTGRTIYQ